MKTSRLYSLWLGLLCCLYIAKMAVRAIIKGSNKTITRTWVDAQMRAWVTNIIKLLSIRCTVINPHHVEPQLGRPTIIMCNHSSLFDIPLSYLAFPHHSMRMLAKKEMAKIPLMGRAMVAAEYPFIDRKNRHQAIKDLKQVQDLLTSGIVMWIAPEGTRSRTGKLAEFKKGGFITAINANATIIPIGIRGANKILPARTLQLCTHQTTEIHIGKPIDAAQFTLNNKEQLMAIVHQEMRSLLGEI